MENDRLTCLISLILPLVIFALMLALIRCVPDGGRWIPAGENGFIYVHNRQFIILTILAIVGMFALIFLTN